MDKGSEMPVSVIIAAAGKGTRMNMGVSKQYVGIRGIPVLSRTIQVFEDLEQVGEIILVVNGNDIDFCRSEIVGRYGFKKVKVIVPGGAERQDSVFNGLGAVGVEYGIVLVHDGARPFASPASIIDSIHAAHLYGASCVAVPVKDTIKKADADGFVEVTLDRSQLWSIQTPQAFKRDILVKAYGKAFSDGFYGTDDAVLVERLGYKLKLVTGSYYNIKITTAEDLVIAGAITDIQD